MTRLLTALLVVGSIGVACGSGGETQPTGTATSERVERQATVAQQQQQAAPASEVEGQDQEEAAEPQQQITAPEEEPQEQQVVELPTEIVGVHKGVRSERNVLGEPDATVEIRYYGDFT